MAQVCSCSSRTVFLRTWLLPSLGSMVCSVKMKV